MNSVTKTVIGKEGIGGAIHEAAGSRLLDQCQKINGCESGECKVSLGHKLSAKYVFHTLKA